MQVCVWGGGGRWGGSEGEGERETERERERVRKAEREMRRLNTGVLGVCSVLGVRTGVLGGGGWKMCTQPLFHSHGCGCYSIPRTTTPSPTHTRCTPHAQVSRKKMVLEHLVVRKLGDSGREGGGGGGGGLKQHELDDILRCVCVCGEGGGGLLQGSSRAFCTIESELHRAFTHYDTPSCFDTTTPISPPAPPLQVWRTGVV